jgi:hypothetical protein
LRAPDGDSEVRIGDDEFRLVFTGPHRAVTRRRAIALAGTLVLVAAAWALLFVDWRTIGPSNVLVTLDAEMYGRKVTLSGETDLPDGTELDWDVAKDDSAEFRLDLHGTTTVADGGFRVDADFVDLAPGTPVVVAVRFYPGDWQPAEVVERFGENGERLRGSGLRHESESPFWYVEKKIEVQPG